MRLFQDGTQTFCVDSYPCRGNKENICLGGILFAKHKILLRAHSYKKDSEEYSRFGKKIVAAFDVHFLSDGSWAWYRTSS
jgi:hypothetical protein